MIPVSEARAYVLSELRPLAPRDVEVADALGCVAADSIIATEPVPSFLNSAMDGFALRASDAASAPATLEIVGLVLAGDAPTHELGPGEAMRIMTGAPLPAGADAVCKIEDVTLDGDGRSVTVPGGVRAGDYVREAGGDVAVGQELVARGDVLSPAHLGVLASQGIRSLRVHPRPRVGVLSTGNELADGPGPLTHGQIRDVNRPTLLASLRRSGFEPVDLGGARDDETEITRALRDAVDRCDAVISTGGVSVGDVDFVKSVLSEICGERARWMQVAVRPGRPFAFGLAGPDATPIFGLPGNPVSTLSSFELFVRPSLRRLAGHANLDRTTAIARTDCALPRTPDGKLHLVHVATQLKEDGRFHISSSSRQGSHLLHAIVDTNAIALVPDGHGYDVGDDVTIVVLDPDRLSTSSPWPA